MPACTGLAAGRVLIAESQRFEMIDRSALFRIRLLHGHTATFSRAQSHHMTMTGRFEHRLLVSTTCGFDLSIACFRRNQVPCAWRTHHAAMPSAGVQNLMRQRRAMPLEL